MGNEGRKREKVLLLRCYLWAWARQSRGFSPACPTSLVWSPVTIGGRKCLCAGVMSGAKCFCWFRGTLCQLHGHRRDNNLIPGVLNDSKVLETQMDLNCGQINLILSTSRGQIVGEKDGQSWSMMAHLQLEGSPSTRSVQGQIVLSLVLSGIGILVHIKVRH